MNRIIPYILFMPLLVGCTNSSSYHGEKITLKYVQEGGVVDTNANQMYNDVVVNKESTIYILGNKTCGGCVSARRTLQAYSEVNHCNIYYISVIDITKSDLNKIQTATTGNYQFKEKDSVPAIYFFFKGDVAFRSGESDLTNYLENYVTVAAPNS